MNTKLAMMKKIAEMKKQKTSILLNIFCSWAFGHGKYFQMNNKHPYSSRANVMKTMQSIK